MSLSLETEPDLLARNAMARNEATTVARLIDYSILTDGVGSRPDINQRGLLIFLRRLFRDRKAVLMREINR